VKNESCSSYGKALLNLAEYKEAMKELQKAYKLDPYNDAISKLIQQVSRRSLYSVFFRNAFFLFSAFFVDEYKTAAVSANREALVEELLCIQEGRSESQ